MINNNVLFNHVFLLVPFFRRFAPLQGGTRTFPAGKQPERRPSMRYYETIFIANPDLSDEEYQSVLTRTREVIEKHNGVFVKSQEWGKQRLAYPIKKQDKGSYVLMNYCGEGGTSSQLERLLKMDERILKSMTVKLADAVDPEELLQKEKEAQDKSATTEEEPSEMEPEAESGDAGSMEEETNE